MQGKIIKGIAGFYYVHDGHSKIYECKAKGIFRNRNVKPLVGDNVEFTILDEAGAEGNIDEILPRKNELIRPAVTNVDQAMILFSVTHPEPNLNLLDRFLVMMAVQGIPVTLCFNKLDLADEAQLEQYRRIYETAGYPVYFVSALEQIGVDTVRQLLRGKTTVLAGPSGVGKSTLTNSIQPAAAMEIGSISKKIRRGKHTTRHSELFYVEDGAFIIDTPGFSSIYLSQLEAGALKDYYPEFSRFEESCRFPGCVHMGETVCGIKDAVRDGKIESGRYENYRLMYQELKEKRRY